MREPLEREPVEHCVLLVSRSGDSEVARLASSLGRIGVPCRTLHADALDGVAVTIDPDDRTLTLGGARFAATATWMRHFSMRATPRRRPRGDHLFYCDSWSALVSQISLVSREVIGARQPGRLEQHAQAAALGIRTPRLVATSDPAAVKRLPPGRYVVKALDQHFVEPRPGRHAWYFPRIVRHPQPHPRPHARPIPGPRFAGAPVVIEEYVPHDAEFRVYVIGGETHTFEVAKSAPHEIWSRPDRVAVRRVEAPDDVAAAARALARRWDLFYGAFDFLTDRGEPVFLEVNVHGDWSWFERKAGAAVVSQAAVRALRDRHRALAPRPPRPEPAVDLLAFLGARPGALVEDRGISAATTRAHDE
jgi:hypothetical protein